MKLDTKEFETKMNKSIAAYNEALSVIRAGRANASVLAHVTVDYYGSPTAITQMAEVKVTDPKTLVIQPWDASTLKNIEKAIQASDVGINPQSDGKVIRLVFPQLTEERRKEIKKNILKLSEDAKIAIRNIRREANEKSKAMKKNGEMTEDEQKLSDKAIQDLTDKFRQGKGDHGDLSGKNAIEPGLPIVSREYRRSGGLFSTSILLFQREKKDLFTPFFHISEGENPPPNVFRQCVRS